MTPPRTNDVLSHALFYAEQMEWRVVPIIPGLKRPPLKAWQNMATTDSEVIRTWFRGRYQGYGVGIATGHASGIWVLDVDTAEIVAPDGTVTTKVGSETLRALLDLHGDLPNTVIARSARGGLHIYFRYPDDGRILRNALIGPNLETRADGGQVVAAPTHLKAGQYRWEAGRAPWEIGVAEAPEWLIDLVCKSAKSEGPPPPEVAVQSSTSPRAIVLPELWNSEGGERPGDAYNAATTWTTLLQGDGFTYGHTDRNGVEYWTRPDKDPREGTSVTVGYGGGDSLVVFTTSIDWLPGGPEGVSYNRFAYMAYRDHGRGYGSDPDWQGAAKSAARILGWPERSTNPTNPTSSTAPKDGTEEADEPRVPVLLNWRVDWSTFWTAERNDHEWLVEPLFARGRAHALYAGAGQGKSFVTLPSAASLATGNPFLLKGVTEPADVLYVDYEMTEDDLLDRLEQFGFGPGDDLSRLHYILLPSIPGLDTPEGGAVILEAALDLGAVAVFFDTTARAVAGEENASDTFRAFYRHTGIPLKAAGITWARLDHAGKDAEKGMRGSSAKNDDVDIVWRLERCDGGAVIRATKRRVMWVPENVRLSVTEHDNGHWDIRSATETWPTGTMEVVKAMDDLDLPLDISRRKAMAAGVHGKAQVIGKAITFRKQRVLRVDDLI